MTPTETLLLNFAVTIVGSGLGTSIVATLLKKKFDIQLSVADGFTSGKLLLFFQSIQNLRKRYFTCSERRVLRSSQAKYRDKELLERMGRSLAEVQVVERKGVLLTLELLEIDLLLKKQARSSSKNSNLSSDSKNFKREL